MTDDLSTNALNRIYGGWWTEEEDKVLREGRALKQPMSFSKLAGMLPGRTRNMVAGRCHRLGLCERAPIKPRRSLY